MRKCWERGDSKGVHMSMLEEAGAASKPSVPLLTAATRVPATYVRNLTGANGKPTCAQASICWLHCMAKALHLPHYWGRNSLAAVPLLL